MQPARSGTTRRGGHHRRSRWTLPRRPGRSPARLGEGIYSNRLIDYHVGPRDRGLSYWVGTGRHRLRSPTGSRTSGRTGTEDRAVTRRSRPDSDQRSHARVRARPCARLPCSGRVRAQATRESDLGQQILATRPHAVVEDGAGSSLRCRRCGHTPRSVGWASAAIAVRELVEPRGVEPRLVKSSEVSPHMGWRSPLG